MKNLKIYLCAIGVALILSCTRSTTYIDREADKKATMEIAKSFYDLSKKKEYNKIYSLFTTSAGLHATAERNKKLKNVLEISNDSLGMPTKIGLIECKTKVIESNKNKSGEYWLSYNVERNGKSYREIFKMHFENGGIKILDYNIMQGN